MSRKITFVKDRDSIFERIYQSFIDGTYRGICADAKKWLIEKKLTPQKVGAGFNSGQWHIRNSEHIEALKEIGFLRKSVRSCSPKKSAYYSFGKNEIIFPLSNEKNEVVNFCSVDMKTGKHSFMNKRGIYPNYPNEETTRLFIVVNVMDAATVIESGVLKENEAVMAMTDKTLTEEQKRAIRNLKHLKNFFYLKSIKSLYER